MDKYLTLSITYDTDWEKNAVDLRETAGRFIDCFRLGILLLAGVGSGRGASSGTPPATTTTSSSLSS